MCGVSSFLKVQVDMPATSANGQMMMNFGFSLSMNGYQTSVSDVVFYIMSRVGVDLQPQQPLPRLMVSLRRPTSHGLMQRWLELLTS